MPEPKGFKEWIKLTLCGICMGASDIIPGISGGTMAFILGIYEDLINSINTVHFSSLIKLNGGKIAWKFLLALVLGILISIASLSHLIQSILNEPIYRSLLYSGFIGLIFASVFFLSKNIHIWNPKSLLGLSLGLVIAFSATIYSPSKELTGDLYHIYYPLKLENSPSNYHSEKQLLLNVPQKSLLVMLSKGIIESSTPITRLSDGMRGPAGSFVDSTSHSFFNGWLIVCGAIAITAMLLPGISGSYLLVILGAYPIVIGAVADFTSSLDQEALLILINFLIGIFIGIFTFSRLIKWLLDHHHNFTLSLLIGFMVGALPAIWPYFSYSYYLLPLKLDKGPQLEVTALQMPDFTSLFFILSLICMLVGFLIVSLLQKISHHKKLPSD